MRKAAGWCVAFTKPAPSTAQSWISNPLVFSFCFSVYVFFPRFTFTDMYCLLQHQCVNHVNHVPPHRNTQYRHFTLLQLERFKKQWFRPTPTTYIYATTVRTPKFSSTRTWPDISRDCVGSHGRGLRKFGRVSNIAMLFPALNHSEQFGQIALNYLLLQKDTITRCVTD